MFFVTVLSEIFASITEDQPTVNPTSVAGHEHRSRVTSLDIVDAKER